MFEFMYFSMSYYTLPLFVRDYTEDFFFFKGKTLDVFKKLTPVFSTVKLMVIYFMQFINSTMWTQLQKV